MGAEWAGFIHHGLLAVLSLAGFHGLFYQENLLKKVIAWVLFQSSALLLILSLTAGNGQAPAVPGGNPLPHALGLVALAVSIGVSMALLALCAIIHKRYGMLKGAEIEKWLMTLDSSDSSIKHIRRLSKN